jgi:hypothetical protein
MSFVKRPTQWVPQMGQRLPVFANLNNLNNLKESKEPAQSWMGRVVWSAGGNAVLLRRPKHFSSLGPR